MNENDLTTELPTFEILYFGNVDNGIEEVPLHCNSSGLTAMKEMDDHFLSLISRHEVIADVFRRLAKGEITYEDLRENKYLYAAVHTVAEALEQRFRLAQAQHDRVKRFCPSDLKEENLEKTTDALKVAMSYLGLVKEFSCIADQAFKDARKEFPELFV